MATAITTVTKTASVVKTTKGSEKKWSEMLSQNRRYDLQLPIDIAKYDHELKRAFNSYQRQKDQTERIWAHKHETWYRDDFVFRNHLLKQLKPITKRFKHINSLSLIDSPQQQPEQILNEEEMSVLALKKDQQTSPVKELPPLKQTKKRSSIRHFQNYPGEQIQPANSVLSKLFCPKILHDYEPRLYSHTHAPFLDVAQRFMRRKPELIEKGPNYNEKHKQQKQHFKMLIDNEQERTRLAALQFGQRLQEDKIKEDSYDYFNNDDDDNSYT
jgi:hypothetical protein